ncbi:hypothetical protein D9Q98_006623 [Chlorella vulgaris]|uniref:Denticleless n=1 Tax=Chlorella vulgaris TaxID=3077 RepID=A0A9D4TKR9_CHLVU|nr:hypothetical protein D9Q98_006623 [Chlorella vulgaris]
MHRGGQSGFAAALFARELHGGTVRPRPCVAEFCCEGPYSGTIINNPGLTGTPAFAAKYSKVYNDSKLLAVADEEGYVSIVLTGAELPAEMVDDWSDHKPRAQWLAHQNAVFDIAWCNGDQHMLTASGDQSIALWETGTAEKLACFKGHSGSVKAVAPMPDTQAVFASGARDGALMVWDARVAAQPDGNGASFHCPVVTIQQAHALSEKQRRRRTPLQGRTRPSVTALEFLPGPGSQMATGGVDGIVKFWDLRQSGGGPTCQAAPGLHLDLLCDASLPHISQKQHGVTSLALHPRGSQLLVSLTGGHHLCYDPLRPDTGPTRWFGGHSVASFYVKAAWSPDGSHIISGSTDRNVYIWEVDAPDGASPYVLSGHQGEVTAVAWCPSDFHQIATTADDATVKVWHISRQQPEEHADDRGDPQPWTYPWQQQAQRQAAAAAAQAAAGTSGGLGGGGGATPGSGLGPAAVEAGRTPWSGMSRAPAAAGRLPPDSRVAPFGGGSAGMLAALRGEGAAAAASAATGSGARPGPLGENRDANTEPAQQAQQQQAQQQASTAHGQQQQLQLHSASGTALPTQQQQQEAVGVTHGPGPAAGRQPAGCSTPFGAAVAAGACPATGSPATHSRTGMSTAGGSGRQMRRIGDLLQSAPSTRRAKQQTSIASFLRSPAPVSEAAAAGRAGAGEAAAAAAGATSAQPAVTGLAGGRGDCSPTRMAGSCGAPGGVASLFARAADSSSKKSGASRPAAHRRAASPLPEALLGLGGSALPGATTLGEQSAKRMRVSFEPQQVAAAAGAAPGWGGSQQQGGQQLQQQGPEGAVAAAQLEPSPEVAAKASAAAHGWPSAAIHRRGSSRENEDLRQSSLLPAQRSSRR